MDDILDLLSAPSMMELWVSREALETVMRAAVSYRVGCCKDALVDELDDAVSAVQDAVEEAFEDPVSVEPF